MKDEDDQVIVSLYEDIVIESDSQTKTETSEKVEVEDDSVPIEESGRKKKEIAMT